MDLLYEFAKWYLVVSVFTTIVLIAVDLRLIGNCLKKLSDVMTNFYHFTKPEDIINGIVLSVAILLGLLVLYFIQGLQWFIWLVRSFIDWQEKRKELVVNLKNVTTDISNVSLPSD
jgi:hypothetical protein